MVETKAAGDMKKILGWQVFDIDGYRYMQRGNTEAAGILAK